MRLHDIPAIQAEITAIIVVVETDQKSLTDGGILRIMVVFIPLVEQFQINGMQTVSVHFWAGPNFFDGRLYFLLVQFFPLT